MSSNSSEEVYIKDPSAKLDYSVDWSEWLSDIGDTIATSSWAVSSGLTKTIETNTTVSATVWLSGGIPGVIYQATNHIVTAAGREDERTITIRVQDR